MKWLIRGIIAFVILVLVTAAIGYAYLQSSLPKMDGEIQLAGLSAPVEIIRDKSGIPHIDASSTEDALFALGFVHAQDRLWQMEMNRRTGAGRLSEILGKDALDTDKFLRTIGFYEAAERAFKTFDEETKSHLIAYTKGVNAFLDQRSGALPPEFLILQTSPERWTPIDSVVWTKMMAWDLGKNWSNEIGRMQLMSILSPEEVNEFFPPYPGEATIPLPDFSGLYDIAAIETEKLMAAAPDVLPPSAGSNNWVVSGTRTETGKPLLANDPHLGLAAPALWYFAHLKTPDFNAIGASLPGVPGIILGRNDKIAWGFTNTGPDTQDLYIEKLNPDNDTQYKTPDGSADFTTRQEVINVKGEEPVEITVRISRHGPIISDVYKAGAKATPENHVLAFAWTSLSDSDTTPMASAKMMRASNWSEFKDAIRLFSSPQQNIVYADVDGNIGYYAPAQVPVRKDGNLARGRLPVPGWLAEYDWDGFIPFEELPQAYNPPRGFHYTANQKIIPDNYPHFITSDWSVPYRADRIKERLEQEEKHSIQTFVDLHADVKSLMAIELLDVLLTTRSADERSGKALVSLSTWDGQMTRKGNAPLIFNAWIRALNKAIYSDELGEFFPRYWRHRPIFILNVLLNNDGQGRWCDDRTTDLKENCGAILQASLNSALDDLETRYGSTMEDWNWGEAHFAFSDHLPFSKVSGLDKIFDIRVPSAGGSFTVNVGRNRPADEKHPFANTHAASLRAIYDFSDLDNSLFMHSTGQSGIIFSSFYDDMAEEWADTKYRRMTMDKTHYSRSAEGTLLLKPTAP
ncbi:MAG: penicillin acylase family protein [Sneathiella sp.]